VSALAASGMLIKRKICGSTYEPGLTEPPHSWAIISPDQSTSGHVEVLVSTGNTVITLDALERIDQVC
jgi:hypothetical protein